MGSHVVQPKSVRSIIRRVTSWNPDDATANCGWVTERTKLALLSGMEGWRTLSTNYNNVPMHTEVGTLLCEQQMIWLMEKIQLASHASEEDFAGWQLLCDRGTLNDLD